MVRSAVLWLRGGSAKEVVRKVLVELRPRLSICDQTLDQSEYMQAMYIVMTILCMVLMYMYSCTCTVTGLAMSNDHSLRFFSSPHPLILCGRRIILFFIAVYSNGLWKMNVLMSEEHLNDSLGKGAKIDMAD